MKRLLWPVALLATLAILYLAKPILVPLLFAILLAQLLAPVVKRLEHYVPTAIAAFIAIALVGVLFAGVLVLVSNQLSAFETSLPKLQERLTALYTDFSHYLGREFNITRIERDSMMHKGLENAVSAPGSAVAVTLSAVTFTISTLAEIALVSILSYLMLYYRRHFGRQILALARRSGSPAVVSLVESTTQLGQSYVAGLGLVMAIVGTADTIGFFLVKAPFPILFGFLGACSVLIPYVGIAVVAPVCVILAWISGGSVAVAGGVLLVFVAVHFLEGNVVSPYVVGSKVNLNPLATILAVLCGGELWGPAGMCLFIPLVGILKLVLDAWPPAEPLARLLGVISAKDNAPRRRIPFVGRILGRVIRRTVPKSAPTVVAP